MRCGQSAWRGFSISTIAAAAHALAAQRNPTKPGARFIRCYPYIRGLAHFSQSAECESQESTPAARCRAASPSIYESESARRSDDEAGEQTPARRLARPEEEEKRGQSLRSSTDRSGCFVRLVVG